MTEPIRILISACLLGDRVRYDGGHKHEPYITETLGKHFEWVKVCPEVDCGLPTPRESMRLVGDPARPRLVTGKTGIDFTVQMERFAGARLRELEALDLCGYICKKDSPSSGMARVKVYDRHGTPSRTGTGMFTRMFMERFPFVPVEEEGRLHDPVLRELFVERVFCLRRWRSLVASGPRRRQLIEFHTDHKLVILAHGRRHNDALGRLVASAAAQPIKAVYDEYFRLFSAALAERTTVRKHTDVLLHMVGYFKQQLSPDEKRELLEVVEQYHRRLVPLVVPLTLVRHYVRKYDAGYLARQVYLSPHPVELMLRNHV